MASVTLSDVVPHTLADAGVINNNNASLRSAINGGIDNANIAPGAGISPSKLSTPGGTTAFLRADGTWATPSAGIAPGIIAPFAGPTAPTGWLICDGSAVDRTTYAALFAAIGVAYGAGNGSTTFNVPDIQGRFPIGKGTHGYVNTLNQNDGLAVGSRLPQHRHTVTDPGHYHSANVHYHDYTGSANDTLRSGGGSATVGVAYTGISVGVAGTPLDTVPYIVVNYVIKV